MKKRFQAELPGGFKAEIFKSQRLVAFGMKNEAKPVLSCSIAQGDVEELKAVKASGIADNDAAEQLAVRLFTVYFNCTGILATV